MKSFVCFVVSCVSWLSAAAQIAPPSPPRWPPRSAIRVWIDTSTAPPGSVALVEKALQTWTHAADGRLTLSRARTRDEARITVKFAPNNAVYGETAPHLDSATGLITSADVVLNATPADTVDPRIVFYLTALHELGHALGLPHTDDSRDIMYKFRAPEDGARYFENYMKLLTSPTDIGGTFATGLSPRDVTALRALYDR